MAARGVRARLRRRGRVASARMKVICGLGNPGDRYRFTRHNVGFRVVDLLADRWGLTGEGRLRDGAALLEARRPDHGRVLLVKPMRYMNRSGAPLRAALRQTDVDVALRPPAGDRRHRPAAGAPSPPPLGVGRRPQRPARRHRRRSGPTSSIGCGSGSGAPAPRPATSWRRSGPTSATSPPRWSPSVPTPPSAGCVTGSTRR